VHSPAIPRILITFGLVDAFEAQLVISPSAHTEAIVISRRPQSGRAPTARSTRSTYSRIFITSTPRRQGPQLIVHFIIEFLAPFCAVPTSSSQPTSAGFQQQGSPEIVLGSFEPT
jgi:hypothetical protein